MKKSRKILIAIVIVLLILLIVLGIVLSTKDNKKEGSNQYEITGEVKEEDGTTKYTNKTLSNDHCLDNVCIGNATFYYTDEGGRVDYTIENRGEEDASGYYKMIFAEQSLVIIFHDLEPGAKIETTSQYIGMEIQNKEDYKLEKMTEEEINNIIVSD